MLLELEAAYIRRQRWLARLQAVEIVNALSEALGGKSAESGAKTAKRYREMPLEGLMAQMGTRWH